MPAELFFADEMIIKKERMPKVVNDASDFCVLLDFVTHRQ